MLSFCLYSYITFAVRIADGLLLRLKRASLFFSLSGAYLMLKCETRRRGVHKCLGLRLLSTASVYCLVLPPTTPGTRMVVVIMSLLLTSDIALKHRILLFITSHTIKSNDTLLTSDTRVKLCNCLTDSCFVLYFLCRRTRNFG